MSKFKDLNELYDTNLINNKKKNDEEVELLKQYDLCIEAVNIIVKRAHRLKAYKIEKPKRHYEKQKHNIIKHLTNKYKNDDEYKDKVKKTALEYYNKNKEEGKIKRREYYHKHKKEINLKNKERNRIKREKLKEEQLKTEQLKKL